MRIQSLLVLPLLSLVLVSPFADADRDDDQREVLERVRAGQIRPLTELMAQNPRRFSGKLLDVELEEDDGRLLYEIEILGKDGVVREFELDPVTGVVLKEEIED